MKRISLLILITSLFISCASIGPEGKLEQQYQANADKIRINDIQKLAEIILQYHKKTGHYPLADGSYKLPAYVAITDKKEYVRPGFIDKDIFINEIRSVLGENTIIPMDPQKGDMYARRYYLYSTEGDVFYVSARLFKETPFTQPVAKYNHTYILGGHQDTYIHESSSAANTFMSFSDAMACENYGDIDLIISPDGLIVLPFIVMNHEEGEAVSSTAYVKTSESIGLYFLDALANKHELYMPKDVESQAVENLINFTKEVGLKAGAATGTPLDWGHQFNEITNENIYVYLPIGVERESSEYVTARLYVLIANNSGDIVYAQCMPYNPIEWATSKSAYEADLDGRLPLTK